MQDFMRHVGDVLKYEPMMVFPSVEPVPPLPEICRPHFIHATIHDQYTCPNCGAPARRGKDFQALSTEMLAPRLYAYRCISGHLYLVRFDYDTRSVVYRSTGHAWYELS